MVGTVTGLKCRRCRGSFFWRNRYDGERKPTLCSKCEDAAEDEFMRKFKKRPRGFHLGESYNRAKWTPEYLASLPAPKGMRWVIDNHDRMYGPDAYNVSLIDCAGD